MCWEEVAGSELQFGSGLPRLRRTQFFTGWFLQSRERRSYCSKYIETQWRKPDGTDADDRAPETSLPVMVGQRMSYSLGVFWGEEEQGD